VAEPSMDSDTEKEMAALIRSAEGIKLAVHAANNGVPSLCGVDKLLREKLGSKYSRINNGTWWAGFYVKEIMLEMGFVAGPTQKCPDHCTAGEGLTFKPPTAGS
jgi:hypothetical protein